MTNDSLVRGDTTVNYGRVMIVTGMLAACRVSPISGLSRTLDPKPDACYGAPMASGLPLSDHRSDKVRRDW